MNLGGGGSAAEWVAIGVYTNTLNIQHYSQTKRLSFTLLLLYETNYYSSNLPKCWCEYLLSILAISNDIISALDSLNAESLIFASLQKQILCEVA